jgi:transposase
LADINIRWTRTPLHYAGLIDAETGIDHQDENISRSLPAVLVLWVFYFYMIEAKPENLIGDRAYDSDKLDKELRQDGVEMVAPHRRNRGKPRTQDGRRLRRYERRWLVERFFAWIQWQRRLLVRWEYYAENCLGFVQLATIAILLKQF